MNVFIVGITERSVFGKFLFSAGIVKVRREEHRKIRTTGTESYAIKHFQNLGMDVLFIRTYALKPGEIAELI